MDDLNGPGRRHLVEGAIPPHHASAADVLEAHATERRLVKARLAESHVAELAVIELRIVGGSDVRATCVEGVKDAVRHLDLPEGPGIGDDVLESASSPCAAREPGTEGLERDVRGPKLDVLETIQPIELPGNGQRNVDAFDLPDRTAPEITPERFSLSTADLSKMLAAPPASAFEHRLIRRALLCAGMPDFDVAHFCANLSRVATEGKRR